MESLIDYLDLTVLLVESECVQSKLRTEDYILPIESSSNRSAWYAIPSHGSISALVLWRRWIASSEHFRRNVRFGLTVTARPIQTAKPAVTTDRTATHERFICEHGPITGQVRKIAVCLVVAGLATDLVVPGRPNTRSTGGDTSLTAPTVVSSASPEKFIIGPYQHIC